MVYRKIKVIFSNIYPPPPQSPRTLGDPYERNHDPTKQNPKKATASLVHSCISTARKICNPFIQCVKSHQRFRPTAAEQQQLSATTQFARLNSSKAEQYQQDVTSARPQLIDGTGTTLPRCLTVFVRWFCDPITTKCAFGCVCSMHRGCHSHLKSFNRIQVTCPQRQV